MSALANIRTKVRRLTGRPSPQQITDAQIDEYVNTFYLYDMPETLRLFSQDTVFEFMTTPNVDQYDLAVETAWTGIENVPVRDLYINLSPPAYVAGYQCFWSQSNQQFFQTYPKLAEISTSIQGNGTPGPYTLTFANTPILQNQVTAGAIDSTGATIKCIDVPTDRTAGTWQIINTNTPQTGSIDYINGSVSITFVNNIPSTNQVTFTAVPYVAARPQALLYYDDILTLRPVPDREYLVSLNAFKRPTQLIESGEFPELRQWWQYLAYGAAKKVFEDSQDPEGVKVIMPEFKSQESMVVRRTIVQQTTERTATIFTEMSSFPYSNFNNRF